MAVTVEELQILLSCDASQAEKVLQEVNALTEKVVKKMSKTVAGGGTRSTNRGKQKEELSEYDKLAKKLATAEKKLADAQRAFDGSDKARVNVGKLSAGVKNLRRQFDNARKAADKLYSPEKAESFAETEEARIARLSKLRNSYAESERVPYAPPTDKHYDPAAIARQRAEAQAWINSRAAQGQNRFGIDSNKILNGSPYEKLQQQFALASAKAEELKRRLDSAMNSGASNDRIIRLATQLQQAAAAADRLAEKMAAIEDKSAASPATAPAENIKRTGNEAEAATPKVERYNRAVSKGSKGASVFSSMFSKFGGMFKKHHGFLERFGSTLKRVIMRMMAMGLIRGVLRGFSEGIKLLAKSSTEANRQLSRFTNMGNAVKTAMGSALLSVLNALAPILFSIASAAITAANAVARFFAVLGGGGSYFAVKMADNFDDLADSASGAGGAAKGMLAAFDELNVIGNKGGGGGGGGNLTGTTVGLEKATSKLAELLKAEEFEKAGYYVAELLDKVILDIDKWFLNLDKKQYGKKFAEFLNGIFKNENLFKDIGKTVGDGINTITHSLLDFFRNFDAQQAASALATSLNTAIKTIDWESIGQTLISGAESALLFISEFLADFDWLGLFNGISKIVMGAIEEIVSNPVTIVRILGNLVISVAKIIGSLAISSVTGILYSIAGLIKPWAPDVADILTGVADDMTQAWNEDCDRTKADFDRFCDKMEEGFDKLKTSADTSTTKTGASFTLMGDKVSATTDKVTGLQNEINKLDGQTATATITTVMHTIQRTTVESHVAQSGAAHSGSVGKFASGGIVYGNTLANVGEYANARVNPEVIAPLSDLQGILERTGNGSNKEAIKEQNRLLTEQNALLRQIAKKDLTISPSASLGQVVAKSNALYARS